MMVLGPCYSKSSQGTSSFGITREVVENMDSKIPSQSYWLSIPFQQDSLGDLSVHWSLRSDVLENI